MLVDDSKRVYSRGGLATLEEAVLIAIPPFEDHLGALLSSITLPWVRSELDGEAWFNPADAIPIENDQEGVWVSRRTVGDAWCGTNATMGSCLAAIVPTPRFNRICDRGGSKAAVLAQGFVELAAASVQSLPADGVPVHFLGDKQGGRNFYAALIQQAFPGGWVVAERESAEESRYRVEQLERPVSVTFRPRADGDSVAVAIASMLCKYLREVCMRQFNRFWAQHVPGLEPTAGYPVDAKRFYSQILPAMAKLGMTADAVWRKK
jgi:hypothetical protein